MNFTASGELDQASLAASALEFMQSYVDEARRQLVKLRLVSASKDAPQGVGA